VRKIKENVYIQLFVIYSRFIIGSTFVFASIIKIKGKRFTGINGETEPINSAWHFFETMYQSGLYWQFLGTSQFFAGALLMSQRYSLAGALLFLPISANIFVITLSYYFAFTPIITGMIFIVNLLLLIWDWERLKILFNLQANNPPVSLIEREAIWQYVGLVLLFFTTLYRILYDEYNVIFWGLGSVGISIAGFIIWKLKIKKTLSDFGN
jgi:hypothetical protein